MILHKKIKPEDVLLLLTDVIGRYLPVELKDSDVEITLSFCEDHSLEIYLNKFDQNQVVS